MCRVVKWYHPSSLFCAPVGLAESHIPGHPSMCVCERRRECIWMSVYSYLCDVTLCVCVILFAKEVFGVSCDILSRSKPHKLDRLYSLICLPDNHWGWNWGVRGIGQGRVRGVYVFVCCCPKDVLVLIQRPSIEQYTHAFSNHLWCACAHISHAG